MFSEARGLHSPGRAIDLGEFLDRKPEEYDFKRTRANYDRTGPLEKGYRRPDYGRMAIGLYSVGILRPNRNPALYKQSSDYIREFSQALGNPESSFSYKQARRYSLS